jgi:hypothetical protein
MRTSIAAMMAATVMFVGLYALSFNFDQVQSDVTTTPETEAYDLTLDVFGGLLGGGGGEAVVWFGAVGIVCVALGILVSVGGGR